MAVPAKAQIKVALLELVADQREFNLAEIMEELAIYFELTDEDRRETACGGSNRFSTRCSFARLDLKNEGLLESTSSRQYRITPLGLEAVRRNPEPRISVGFSDNHPIPSKSSPA